MIDLAPGHKQGFPVASPVIVAGGMVGYGEVIPRGLVLEALGALVVGPILARSRAGAPLPRLAESTSGFVLDSGLQNRGATTVLGKLARLWPRLGCPVVAQVADGDPRSLARLVDQMVGLAGLSGFELLPLTSDLGTAQRLVRTVVQHSDLPVWVKVPLESAAEWAAPLVDEGANALVIAQPPTGTLLRSVQDAARVRGAVYGPGTLPLMLDRLAAVAGQNLSCAVVACGGIHTAEQARQALALGAQAVQLDTVIWVEPGAAGWIAGELAQGARAGKAGPQAGGR